MENNEIKDNGIKHKSIYHDVYNGEPLKGHSKLPKIRKNHK